MPASPTAAFPSPNGTAPLRPLVPVVSPEHDTTDYELSASVVSPAIDSPSIVIALPETGKLDADTRRLFQQRLKLCFLVAAFPFLFFFVSSIVGFIELFGKDVVGYTGIILSGMTLTALLATALLLHVKPTMTENTLRVIEIGAFGIMAICFAYWQFTLMTAPTLRAELRMAAIVTGMDARQVAEATVRQEQYSVLAAALIVHFNWFALMVFHGVLVPNTLARGAGVILSMATVALAIDTFAVSVHETTGDHPFIVYAVAGAILGAGAGLSIFGTAKTAALRKEVETAKAAVRALGQYRLRKKLGQGGMGEVYLAEHQLLKRPCAVKRIHPKYLNNVEQVKRFQREVQTTAQLRHPNTVEVYDYGQAEDGTFYYVMEYLPGLSLEEIVSRAGPLPPERVVHILRQVCGALAEAHRHGLIHRDVKPSNILVFPDINGVDQAKVVDFGLVQQAVEEESTSRITRDGLIVGTPEYMSPEQAQGMPLDERSDLFSLGSVAYYLLTGHEAFHRDTPLKTLLAVVNEEPRPLAELNGHLPQPLNRVIAKCLAKPLIDRYASAAYVAESLSDCESIALKWTPERSREWWGQYCEKDAGTDLSTPPLASEMR
jgi:serine/threonine-protein kinase